MSNGVTGKASLVRRILKQLEEAGTHHRAASSKRNAAGRTTSYQGWYPTNHASLSLVPNAGTHEDAVSLNDDVRPPDVCLRGTNDGGTHSEDGLEATPDHDEDPANAPSADELEQVLHDPAANGNGHVDQDEIERLAWIATVINEDCEIPT